MKRGVKDAIFLILVAVLSTVLVSFSMLVSQPRPYQGKVTLIFEIDEGESGKELISKYKDNFTQLDAALTNIYDGIQPLLAKYAIAVLIDPALQYNASGYDGKDPSVGLNRLSPQFLHAMDFFENHDIPVYLDIYSSDIRTEQNGELGNLPAVPLHYGDAMTQPGLSVDIEALAALKAAYPSTFAGIRFHELIGTNQIGLSDQKNGKLASSHGFIVQGDVVEGIIDTCALTGLNLVWSDHDWNLIPQNTNDPSYAEFQQWLDYAVGKLGHGQLTIDDANNGWPVYQYVSDSFYYQG